MRFLLALLIAAALPGCGTPQPDARAAQTAATVTKLVNIPGTRAFIAPPARFKVATNFPGLERDESSMIQVTDLVGGSFYKNAATFDREGFAAKGAEVLDYRDTTVNNFPAKFVSLQASEGTKSYGLAFGDTTFCVLVMALVPEGEKVETERQIKQSLFSMRYDKKFKVDPFAAAPFVLDDRNAKFKFFQLSANMYIYAPTGTKSDADAPDNNAPMVMVMPLPSDPATSLPDQADVLVGKLEQYGLTETDVRGRRTVRIDGKTGIESEVYGLMKGKKALFYQLLLPDADRMVLVQGVIPEQLPASLKDVREFAHTIRFK